MLNLVASKLTARLLKDEYIVFRQLSLLRIHAHF